MTTVCVHYAAMPGSSELLLNAADMGGFVLANQQLPMYRSLKH